MKRLSIITLILLFALVAGQAWTGALSVSAAARNSTPAGPAQFAYPEADNIRISQDCLPGNRVRINVFWNAYSQGAQWVDLSLSNNGWVFGTFLGAGPFAPQDRNMYWDGLLPGLPHYLRINTLTAFGWYPSQTVTFFTRNDCGSVPAQDTDSDGIPDYLDRCPFQFGPASNGGCPVTPPPGPVLCDPVTGWCPGNPPPSSRCDLPPQILIFPPPTAGCVWATKGEAAAYNNGEAIRICYWVNQPMNVLVQSTRPDGAVQTNVGPGYDDGKGNCIDGVVGVPPAGTRTVRLYTTTTGSSYDKLLDTGTWVGQ